MVYVCTVPLTQCSGIARPSSYCVGEFSAFNERRSTLQSHCRSVKHIRIVRTCWSSRTKTFPTACLNPMMLRALPRAWAPTRGATARTVRTFARSTGWGDEPAAPAPSGNSGWGDDGDGWARRPQRSSPRRSQDGWDGESRAGRGGRGGGGRGSWGEGAGAERRRTTSRGGAAGGGGGRGRCVYG